VDRAIAADRRHQARDAVDETVMHEGTETYSVDTAGIRRNKGKTREWRKS
jgi:predicted GTPase